MPSPPVAAGGPHGLTADPLSAARAGQAVGPLAVPEKKYLSESGAAAGDVNAVPARLYVLSCSQDAQTSWVGDPGIEPPTVLAQWPGAAGLATHRTPYRQLARATANIPDRTAFEEHHGCLPETMSRAPISA